MSVAFQNPVENKRSVSTEQLFGSWDKIHNMLREIFPTKTAENLSSITGLSIRAWEYSLSCKRKISLESFLALLDTEYGPEILSASLTYAKQPWVRDFRIWWDLQRLKAERDALNKRIEAMERK